MNRFTGIVLVICLLFTQVSCWDVQDVANTAFITAIGLDISKNPGMIKVTFVIPRPSKIRNRSDQNYAISETVEVESLTRAVEKLGTRLSRKVRFGHLQVIVIGEKLSRKNFRGIIDLFSRNPEIALRTRLMFVHGGEAIDVLEVSPILNRSLASELVGMAMIGRDNALVRTVGFQDVRKGLLKNNGTVLASRLIINNKNKKPFIEYEGGAVIKDWRIIGWLDENEGKAANWFLESPKPKVSAKVGGALYTYSIAKRSTKIIPITNAGSLSFLIKVNASGNIEEGHFGQDLSQHKNLERLEKILSAIVIDQVTNAVYKSQKELRTDYLGFGKALEINDPQLYRKLDWPKVYPNVPVTVKVQTNVHRFGKTK